MYTELKSATDVSLKPLSYLMQTYVIKHLRKERINYRRKLSQRIKIIFYVTSLQPICDSKLERGIIFLIKKKPRPLANIWPCKVKYALFFRLISTVQRNELFRLAST